MIHSDHQKPLLRFFFSFLFQASQCDWVLPLRGVCKRASFCCGIGGIGGGRGGGGGGYMRQGGCRGRDGLRLSINRAVCRRWTPALALQAAAAAALQRRGGGFGATSQRRCGRARQRWGPHAVTEDACAHEKLPGAISWGSWSAGARRSDVVWWQTTSAGDVINPHIWAIESLGSGLETQHPLSLLHLPSLMDRCHDGFWKVVIAPSSRLLRCQALGTKITETLRSCISHGQTWRGEVSWYYALRWKVSW